MLEVLRHTELNAGLNLTPRSLESFGGDNTHTNVLYRGNCPEYQSGSEQWRSSRGELEKGIVMCDQPLVMKDEGDFRERDGVRKAFQAKGTAWAKQEAVGKCFRNAQEMPTATKTHLIK